MGDIFPPSQKYADAWRVYVALPKWSHGLAAQLWHACDAVLQQDEVDGSVVVYVDPIDADEAPHIEACPPEGSDLGVSGASLANAVCIRLEDVVADVLARILEESAA